MACLFAITNDVYCFHVNLNHSTFTVKKDDLIDLIKNEKENRKKCKNTHTTPDNNKRKEFNW